MRRTIKELLALSVLPFIIASCSSTNSTSTISSPSNNNNTSNSNLDDVNKGESKSLVAYFSGTGNTKRVAEFIKNKTDGDLFEINPTEPYTDADLNYSNSNSRVSKEHNDESLRDIPLQITTPSSFNDYSIVYIGFPIWWGIPAWPVNNFVKDNDFTGKTVIPFATSASSGMGNSGSILKAMNNTGTWINGQRFSSNVSEDTVNSWIDGLNL